MELTPHHGDISDYSIKPSRKNYHHKELDDYDYHFERTPFNERDKQEKHEPEVKILIHNKFNEKGQDDEKHHPELTTDALRYKLAFIFGSITLTTTMITSIATLITHLYSKCP